MITYDAPGALSRLGGVMVAPQRRVRDPKLAAGVCAGPHIHGIRHAFPGRRSKENDLSAGDGLALVVDDFAFDRTARNLGEQNEGQE
jgi:hypothetical protein